MKKRFVRERRYVCGERYMEVDVYPLTERVAASGRRRKEQDTGLVQQNLNAKHARRYLRQLLAANFDERDLHLTLTYGDELLPEDADQAGRDMTLYLRRVRYRCAKLGLAAPAYVAVTEWREEDPAEGQKAVRYHHHLILRCALGRDELEALWTRDGERLGRCNADRLQPDKGALTALAEYITKYANRKRRWRQSRGLRKPKTPRPADGKWTRRKVERAVKSGAVYDAAFWRGRFPGWELAEADPVYNDVTGEWSVYIALFRPGGTAKVRQS